MDFGYFQDEFTSDPSFNPGPDPTMPSELGGYSGDWNPDAGGFGGFTESTGAYGVDEAGPVAGPDLVDPGFDWGGAGLALGGAALGQFLGGGAPALDNVDPTQGGALFPGGGMDALDFSAAGLPAMRGVPWGAMTRQVRNAARIFGPAMLLPIVNIVAQYWTARLQRLGMQVSISPSSLVLKVLSKRGRRGTRGITGRQLSITRRTITKVQRMHALLSHFTHHRAPARARYAFQRRRRK